MLKKFTTEINKLIPEKNPEIAVAVSGGGDSMALTLLANHWISEAGGKLTGLTVDHNLRPGSTKEAAQVTKWLKTRKIKHHILKYKGNKPKSGLMNFAREIRYRLLTDWCKKNKIKYLLVAHNLEDQAETFLMRLERGSGVDGLSSIPKINMIGKIQITRPLLGFSREELRKFLRGENQEWLEDPTNDNTDFKRNKIRKILFSIDTVERDTLVKRLSNTANNMGRVRDFLETETSKSYTQCVVKDGARNLLNLKKFSTLHPEIALRLLSDLLLKIGNKKAKPRFENLEKLYNKLKDKGNFKGATLCGCKLSPSRKKKEKGLIVISQE